MLPNIFYMTELVYAISVCNVSSGSELSSCAAGMGVKE